MKWLSMTRSKKGEKRGKYPKSGHHLQGFNVPVYLNVYDISHLNTYFHWTGIGIFHSGVEVYGVEYGFGAHDWQTSGVFEVEPRRCPRFKFRKSIFMGMINKNPIQVHEFFENQSHDYKGNAYHLILKNCNHFTTDICHKLRVRPVPKWVNRLARIVAMCNCILPEDMKDPNLKTRKDQTRKSLPCSLSRFQNVSYLPSKKLPAYTES